MYRAKTFKMLYSNSRPSRPKMARYTKTEVLWSCNALIVWILNIIEILSEWTMNNVIADGDLVWKVPNVKKCHIIALKEILECCWISKPSLDEQQAMQKHLGGVTRVIRCQS